MNNPASDAQGAGTLSSNRRSILRIAVGASLALAGMTTTGCANMKAEPKPKRGDSYITGRGGGPGGGMR